MRAADIKLEHARALLLVGPEGCGKTGLARRIAGRHGTFAEISASILGSSLLQKDLFANRYHTIIVHEFDPSNGNQAADAKALISGGLEIRIRPPYSPYAVAVPAPFFIFCSNDPAALQLEASRRFTILQIAGGNHA